MTSYTSSQLDTLLIPSFVAGLSSSQQISGVLGSSSSAVSFRNLSPRVYLAAKNAFFARKRGTCTSAFRVPYATSTSPLIISFCSLADYYQHLLATPVSGFPLLFSRVNNYKLNQVKCCPRGTYGGIY